MFTYKFFRNPKNGSLHLRLINNRRKAEMEIGISATDMEFSDAFSPKPKPDNVRLSLTLKGIEGKIRELQMAFINDGLDQNMDVKEIRLHLKDRLFLQTEPRESEKNKVVRNSFLAFARQEADRKIADGTKDLFKQCIRKVEKFSNATENSNRKNPEMLTFDDIDIKWLNNFVDWMIKDDISTNTRARYLTNIRTIFNHAIDEEITDKYPFRRFKIHTEKTRKRALSVEDLRKLFNYPVEEYQKYYLDMFKLSFMLIGINLMDMYKLKEMKNGRIEYRRSKTGRLYSIKVEPEAMEIINRWRGKNTLLNISDRWTGRWGQKSFTMQLNKELKKIGHHEIQKDRSVKIVPEFPELSSYWARHSWATIARKLKISVDDIALGLGHSNGHDMTRIYIDESQEVIDEANRRVLDYVLYGKS